MTAKFKGKYRIESTRLQHWDYRWDAAYFITICTRDREQFFGEIVDGKMQYSPVGAIAHVLWYEIKNHAKNLSLDEFVVMPNHVHGVIILEGNSRPIKLEEKSLIEGKILDKPNEAKETRQVEARHALPQNNQYPPSSVDLPNQLNPDPFSPETAKSPGQLRFRNQGKNTISSIVGSYKSAVTKHAHRLDFRFAWQASFYDHIIRDEEAHERISLYIRNNTVNWKGDRFH